MIEFDGIPHFRFPPAFFCVISGTGAVVPLASGPVALFSDEDTADANGATLTVRTRSGSVWTPGTGPDGLSAEFWAPQFDDVIAKGGVVRQNLRTSDMAEVVLGLTATAAAAVMDLVQPRLDAMQAQLDAGLPATYA